MAEGFVNLATQTQTKKTEWLWQGRIPFGAITILEGDPATNKSTLTYYLTAALTRGRTIYGNPEPVDGGVVLVQGEDSESRLRDSLKLRQAVLQRVRVVDRTSLDSGSSTVLLDGTDETDGRKGPDGLKALSAAVEEVGARLVVVDPVDEFFSRSLSNDDVARRAMTPLVNFAATKNVAVVLVRHMTKTGGGGALHRGRGSIRLISAARSALLLAVDPADENGRILAQSKSNLGPRAPSISFKLGDCAGCPVIRALGASSMAAEDLLHPASPGFGPKLSEAMHAMVRVLAHDPVAISEVTQVLKNAGISQKTIWRAKKHLGIETKADGSGPGTVYYWDLPKGSELVMRLLADVPSSVKSLTSGSLPVRAGHATARRRSGLAVVHR